MLVTEPGTGDGMDWKSYRAGGGDFTEQVTFRQRRERDMEGKSRRGKGRGKKHTGPTARACELCSKNNMVARVGEAT